MHLPPIIGLTGLAGTGKDTVALMLSDQLTDRDLHCYILPLAEPIKAALRTWGVPPAYLEERALKEAPLPGWGVHGQPATPRALMQEVGGMGRAIDESFWLNILARRVLGLPHGWTVIVPDVRYDNEAAWVRGNEGVIVQVVRDGVQPVRAHSSESGLSLPPDYRLSNNGTLVELMVAVERLMQQMSLDRCPASVAAGA